jgi:hypothetical protein
VSSRERAATCRSAPQACACSPPQQPGPRPAAVQIARDVIKGHVNLGTTSIYLQGIDTEEIIATVHARRAPMMSATAGLRL